MKHSSYIFVVFCILVVACGSDKENGSGEAPKEQIKEVDLEASEAALNAAEVKARQERIDKEFPMHGLVTGTQLTVYKKPDEESVPIGWLRVGSRIRMRPDAKKTNTCRSGWYELMPRGYACSGKGIDVGEAPPEADNPIAAAKRDQPLPYDYFFVKEPMVPQYHQLPSRDAQRYAAAYGQKYVGFLKDGKEKQAARFLEGRMGPDSKKPSVVARFLNHAFFIAASGYEVRSRRTFARTTGGGYVKKSQLEQRTGSEFHGWELDAERKLPIAVALRSASLRQRVELPDGSKKFKKDEALPKIERQQLLEDWTKRKRIGDKFYHILKSKSDAYEGKRYVKDWFVSVIKKIKPPFKVKNDEPWIHVDISNQSLVIYHGKKPVYATLVSSGLEGHDTPLGTFTIRKKMVTDTMANLGSVEGTDDRYRIQDVPWTQYFEGSFALHAAFWHHRFGLQKSHGCVNLAPTDALRVFRETWPRIPEGWHGASTEKTGFKGSKVHVTK